jgi:hypothetical protein
MLQSFQRLKILSEITVQHPENFLKLNLSNDRVSRICDGTDGSPKWNTACVYPRMTRVVMQGD